MAHIYSIEGTPDGARWYHSSNLDTVTDRRVPDFRVPEIPHHIHNRLRVSWDAKKSRCVGRSLPRW